MQTRYRFTDACSSPTTLPRKRSIGSRMGE